MSSDAPLSSAAFVATFCSASLRFAASCAGQIQPVITGLAQGRPRPPPPCQASVFCLRASNSGWVIAPLSSNCFAFSISAAAPPLPAVERT